ncbi:MAG: VWA domain-containing protein [Endomicrobium sp.]|nr:VWA domain-containing protein [Endomicrobium sp.]
MRTVIKESSEIIMALDISKSMLAEDSKPSRLEKVKMIIWGIVEENPGEKMGIIIFSGTACVAMSFDL